MERIVPGASTLDGPGEGPRAVGLERINSLTQPLAAMRGRGREQLMRQ